MAIFRDLRGFIEPIQSRKNYLLFFHWFYPDYMPVLIKGVQALSPDPSTHVLLKFLVEFVSNKSQRLSLDVSSANGVLLFRDASQILTIFGKLSYIQKHTYLDNIYHRPTYHIKAYHR